MADTDEKVFEAILRYWKQHAVPPTIRDVMELTSITSTSVVRYWYAKLAQAGRIELIRGHPVPVEIIRLLKEEKQDAN